MMIAMMMPAMERALRPENSEESPAPNDFMIIEKNIKNEGYEDVDYLIYPKKLEIVQDCPDCQKNKNEDEQAPELLQACDVKKRCHRRCLFLSAREEVAEPLTYLSQGVLSLLALTTAFRDKPDNEGKDQQHDDYCYGIGTEGFNDIVPASPPVCACSENPDDNDCSQDYKPA